MVLPSEPAPRRRAAPAHPPGGGWARNTAAGTSGNSLQRRHSGWLLPRTSDWTRIEAQLKNQRLCKALTLQVTGEYQTRRGLCTEAPQVPRSSAEQGEEPGKAQRAQERGLRCRHA